MDRVEAITFNGYKICDDTKCLCVTSIDMGDYIVEAALRYDFDDTERCSSEMDIELNNFEKETQVLSLIDWTYSYNTNYCIECGKKFRNPQEEQSTEREDGTVQFIEFEKVSTQHEDKVHVELVMNKEEKKINMNLNVNDKSTTACFDIKYDPRNGDRL